MTQAPSEGYSLVRLVCLKKWHDVQVVLEGECDHGLLKIVDRIKSRLILHLVCQHQAPPQIVELIAERFPQSISCQENKGRHPLHIACAKGLKPQAIAVLLKTYPQAAGVQDGYGKTPLHYICESYAHNYRDIPGNEQRSPKRGMFNVISWLLKEVPELANIEDLEGMNAIEYAILNGVDIRAIKLMQRSSRESWRALRKEHEEKNHEELRRSIDSLGSSLCSLNLLSEEATSNILTPMTPNEEWPDIEAPSSSKCAAKRRTCIIKLPALEDDMVVQQAARSA